MRNRTLISILLLPFLLGASPSDGIDKGEQWLRDCGINSYDLQEHESEEARWERLGNVWRAIRDTTSDKTMRAALLIQGQMESGWRLDVFECRCPPNQCDGGLAHGPWQLHVHQGEKLDPHSEWCGTSYETQLRAARRALAYWDKATLEEGFRLSHSSKTSPNEKWIAERSAMARELAGKL